MIRRALLAAAVAALVAAPAASAHVQVRPALAAPGDPVLFQVIVPNEKDAHTVEVTLQVPKDVLPFSFEEPDGWTRENKEGAGRQPGDDHVEGRAGRGRLRAVLLPGLDSGAGG